MPLKTSQAYRVQKLWQAGYKINDIMALTNYERADIRRALGQAVRTSQEESDRLTRLSTTDQLKRLMNARPISRSYEDHERIVRSNFPELFEVA